MTSFPLSTPVLPQRHVMHKRSMSDSALERYTTPRTSEWSTAMRRDESSANGQNTTFNRLRSASASDACREKNKPQRPLRPPQGLFGFPEELPAYRYENHPSDEAAPSARKPQRSNSNSSSVRIAPAPLPVVDIRGRAASSPAHISLAKLHTRAVSAVYTSSDYPVRSSPPPERKLNTASTSSMPFVIAMGSPHNPALITPSAAVLPTVCSITRNAPLNVTPPSSRKGVSCTMASSATVSSPISHPDAAGLELPLRPMSTKPTQLTPVTTVRKTCLRSQNRGESGLQSTTSPSHSRSASGGSTRTTVRLPRLRDEDTEHTAATA
jgi:hypothetical protein